MKKFDSFIPIVSEAISGAFGGAVLGNISGMFSITILGAIAGALIVAVSGVRSIRSEKSKVPAKEDLGV